MPTSYTNPVIDTSTETLSFPNKAVVADLNGNSHVLGTNTTANSFPVTMASNQGAIGSLTSPYPQGAVPITAASGDVGATNAVATLAAVAGKTTYITGFSITSTGSTGASTVDVTIVGVITGTMTFIYASVAGATLANAPLTVHFPYPLPASAVNTAIVVTCPSLGTGNLHAAANAYGFQL